MIKVRRVYDPDEAGEKYKVFVDRLWPRGISKEKVGWNEWMKEISPSNELRKWYNHDPAKWMEFRKLYRIELSDRQNELSKLKLLEKEYGTITLLYSSKEEKYQYRCFERIPGRVSQKNKQIIRSNTRGIQLLLI